MDRPKRVILRLQEADLDEGDLYEPVRLYFGKMNRPVQELETNRHFIHIQPPNPHIPQVNPKLHVVIDLEAEKFSGKLSADFPHEIYRVRRIDGTLVMYAFKDGAWYQNFVRKLRSIIDDVYPWGTIKGDLKRSGGTGAQACEACES
ncbi:hypothetical protein BDV23DRAFT_188901 [Aspergillus alliaceus]|uniref:Uncharacterized protein n=1 Tax=Petromyces alliaceus TaxID=209559 RepID=A0A5N7BSF7_PETAA|nr:uncharacterized protein BDW43DRAFT_317057 [Aspergillus alliaceus]KAB8227192.1 hypothetical protein BDW43DRAFT_317057 [Aspergillus alliaceus]KAE8384764.1 hypothetical protein BDV23DRAFT_188901 [Aspergillus alliaceus]